MATSGTTNYDITRDDLITEVLEILGVADEGYTVSAADRTTISRTLNLLLKNYVTKGWLPWKFHTASVTLVSGQQTYTIGPTPADIVTLRPSRIAQAWVRYNNNDTPLIVISHQEYNLLTPKNVAGIPNSLYYDPQLTRGVLYPWPVVNTTGYSLYVSFQEQIEDIASTSGASSENFDLTQEWFLALAWNCAQLVAPKYLSNLQKQQMIAANAQLYLEQAADYSREEATVMFQPNPMMGR